MSLGVGKEAFRVLFQCRGTERFHLFRHCSTKEKKTVCSVLCGKISFPIRNQRRRQNAPAAAAHCCAQMLHVVPAPAAAASSSISHVSLLQGSAVVPPGQAMFADFVLGGGTAKRAKRNDAATPPPPPLDLRALLLRWHTFAATVPKSTPITHWIDYFLSMMLDQQLATV
jgi:hypothetical protein